MGYNPGGRRVDAPVLGVSAAVTQVVWRRLAKLAEFTPAPPEEPDPEPPLAETDEPTGSSKKSKSVTHERTTHERTSTRDRRA